jgi:arabinofuranan 3-O-arabinosyltransferase
LTVAGVRTLVVSALAAAVAVRVTATQPLAGAYARIAADPTGALRGAADGWTVSGTLGDATAQGLREVPLAAFFWLAEVLGLPPVGGRAAWSVLVLVLAVVGAVRLARAQAPGEAIGEDLDDADEPWTPWVGAALFACAPVLVTTVQHSPGDALVVAVLPWLLVPLVRREDGWRAAARSSVWLGLAGAGTPPWALAALAAGAVAAVATSRRPRGAGQLVRWSVLAVASSSWWVAAYVWEAAYATDVSGLSRTEPSTSALADSLGLPGGGWWAVLVALAPLAVAGCAIVLRVAGDLAVAGALLALAGAAVVLGVVSGGWPAWLPLPASAATATESVATPWVVLAGWVGLAALLAWTPLVDHLLARLPRAGAWQPSRETGVVVAAVAVLAVGVVGPVLVAQEDAAEPVATDPSVWAQVAEWSATAPPGRVLVLPAMGGRVEPAVTDALRDRPWISRDTLPLSGPGATAALDSAIGRLSRGHDGAGTAAALRHLGVSYVLLRNDVATAADRDRPLALVRHALVRQGASRVAVVQPGGAEQDVPGIVDLGVRDPAGSLEIWALDQASDGAVLDGDLLAVSGDPGVVGDLADAGLAPDSALVLGPAPEGAAGIVSDSARRQDVDQRVSSDPHGPVLAEAEPRTVRPAGAAAEPTASSTLSGALEVRASSSAADLDGSRRRTGAVPSAAVDANAFTAWQSRRGTLVGQWWEIVFDGETDLTGGTLQVAQNAFSTSLVTRVRLESDAGTTEVDVPADGLVGIGAAGRTERLRVVATAARGTPDATPDATRSFGIFELTLPGLAVRQELVVDGPDADTWVLAARPPSFATCVPSYAIGGSGDPAASETVCNRGVTVDGPDAGPLLRVLRTERGGEVAGRVWVRAADSSQSGDLAAQLARPTILATGSSAASPDLVSGPQAAADADPATAWRPAADDEAPTLELSWDRATRVSGLRVTTAERQLSTRPTHVVVSYGDGTELATGEIGDDGVVELPTVRTRSLSVRFEAETQQTSLDSLTAGSRPVPMTVSEVEVIGGPDVTYEADEVEELPCGSGPDVSIGGETHQTAVTASARQVVEAAVVTATLCERPVLRAGEVSVRIDPSFSWIPLGLVLSPPGGALGTVDEVSAEGFGSAGVPVGTIGATGGAGGAEIDVDGPATVVLAVPAGKGWTAVADGRELPPLTVDGWAQAWQAPDGSSRVRLRYSSVDELRVAAGAAALGWVAVLLLAVSSRSRTRRPGMPLR